MDEQPKNDSEINIFEAKIQGLEPKKVMDAFVRHVGYLLEISPDRRLINNTMQVRVHYKTSKGEAKSYCADSYEKCFKWLKDNGIDPKMISDQNKYGWFEQTVIIEERPYEKDFSLVEGRALCLANAIKDFESKAGIRAKPVFFMASFSCGIEDIVDTHIKGDTAQEIYMEMMKDPRLFDTTLYKPLYVVLGYRE